MKLTQDQCAFNIIYTFSPEHDIDGVTVAQIRQELARLLANEIQESGLTIRYIIPIPSTGIYYAKYVAKYLKIEIINPYKKNKNIRTLRLKYKERHSFYDRYLDNAEVPNSIDDVLFIDEALISGTTTKLVSEWANNQGIRNFSFAFASPPIINYCPNKMVRSVARALDPGAGNMETEMAVGVLSKSLKSTKVIFLPSQKFEDAMSGDRRCTLCFSKIYENETSNRM
jgi:glutamine phosphoribosylpyrophosphate amidotransferase